MKIDLVTAWGHNRGGKGIKANYATKLMRIPLPLEPIVKLLVRMFTNHGVILEIGDRIDDNFFPSREYRKAVEAARVEYEAKLGDRLSS